MTMSNTYTQMIYVAVTTFYLYSKNIQVEQGMTVKQFRDKYKGLCKRVVDEVSSIYQYQLSGEQMNCAIYAYMYGAIDPKDVETTHVYNAT